MKSHSDYPVTSSARKSRRAELIPRECSVFKPRVKNQSYIVDGWATVSPLTYLAYFRSEDQGKLTKFSRLSKQMFPYILRYDARSAESL
jgi:hypothetical protein